MIVTAVAVIALTAALYLLWTRRMTGGGIIVGGIAIFLAGGVEWAVAALVRAEPNPTIWTILPFWVLVVPVVEESVRFGGIASLPRDRGALTNLVSVSLGISATEAVFKLQTFADPDLATWTGTVTFACSGLSSGLLHLLVALVVARRVERLSLWTSWLIAMGVHAPYNAFVSVGLGNLNLPGRSGDLAISLLAIAALLVCVIPLILASRRSDRPSGLQAA